MDKKIIISYLTSVGISLLICIGGIISIVFDLDYVGIILIAFAFIVLLSTLIVYFLCSEKNKKASDDTLNNVNSKINDLIDDETYKSQDVFTKIDNLKKIIDNSVLLENKTENLKKDYLFEDVKCLTLKSFIEQTNDYLKVNFLYNTAMVSFTCSVDEVEVIKKLINEATEIFKPKFITLCEKKIVVFLLDYDVNSSMLVSQLENFKANFHVVKLDNEEIHYIDCDTNIVIYPEVSRQEMLQVLVKKKSKNYLLHNDLKQDYITKNLKKIGLTVSKAVQGAMQAYNNSDVYNKIECVFKSIDELHSFASSGCMIVSRNKNSLIPFFEYAKSKDARTFNYLENISLLDLEEYFNCFDDSGCFNCSDVELLPVNLRNIFYNIEVSSFVHFKIMYQNKLLGIIYFNANKRKDKISFFEREVLLVAKNAIASILSIYMMGLSYNRENTLLNTILNYNEQYVYGVEENTHLLTFCSKNLQALYPDYLAGKKCYEVFNNGEECKNCPLKNKSIVTLDRPKLGIDIEAKVINRLPGVRKESLIFLENVVLRHSKVLENELDPIYKIFNYTRLESDLEYELKKGGKGYIALFDFNENKERYSPDEFINYLKTSGYDNNIYIIENNILLITFRNINRTEIVKAIELIYNGLKDNFVNTIFGYYGIFSYPSDIFDVKSLSSLLTYTINEMKAVGTNNLYTYGEKGYRKLEREEYILDVVDAAIKKNKFESYIQPIIDIQNKTPVGAELLLRLNDPTRGNIPPNEFVPVAVKNKRMYGIELKLIESAGELWRTHGFNIFKQVGVKHISINISLDSLSHPEFIIQVKKLFSRYHFPKQFLQFEIPENIVNKYFNEIKNMIASLKECGVYMCLDNFTSSYINNVEKLKELNFDEIKIDRSCVVNIENQSRNILSLKYVVDLVKDTGAFISIQGIENEMQMNIIKDMGVNFAQGFYIHKPCSQLDYIHFLNFKN